MRFMKQWRRRNYLLLWRDIVEGQLRHESHMVVVNMCPLCHFRFLTSVDCNIFFPRLNFGLIKILHNMRKPERRFLSPFPTPSFLVILAVTTNPLSFRLCFVLLVICKFSPLIKYLWCVVHFEKQGFSQFYCLELIISIFFLSLK